MITPFEIYLILQLDTFNAFFLLISIVGMSISGLFFMEFLCSYEESIKKLKHIPVKYFSAFFVLFVLTIFIPSTKTAAAMLLIPKLTSDEIIKPMSSELKELYNLTKDAIKKIAE